MQLKLMLRYYIKNLALISSQYLVWQAIPTNRSIQHTKRTGKALTHKTKIGLWHTAFNPSLTTQGELTYLVWNLWIKTFSRYDKINGAAARPALFLIGIWSTSVVVLVSNNIIFT